jgi:predicted AAA+ superfamily ATPase
MAFYCHKIIILWQSIAMELSRLRFQNKHWDSSEFLKEDLYLKQLFKASIVLKHPIEEKLKLNEDRVYIIRGPRQIGKTTLLKKLIKNLIENNIAPRRIFYFAFDIGNIKDDNEVAELLYTYINFVRNEFKNQRLWIFLDEVTYTPDWAVGIKRVYDSGFLQDTTLVVTGSSALDLKKGGERLPGRRGISPHENDLNMLPLNFRAYLKNVYKLNDLPSVLNFTSQEVYNVCYKASYYEVEIRKAFEEYLLCGGFPLSILCLKEQNLIESSVYYTYFQALIGDLVKAGKKEWYIREILQVLFQKMHEPIDWFLISKESGIGSHHTVKDYIEILEAFFVLKVIYAIKQLGKNEISLKKRKKVYFSDPFLYSLFRAWTKGETEPFKETLKLVEDPVYKSKLVENVVAIHLSNLFPMVSYWRNKGEIDFIGMISSSSHYFEVKYQEKITSEDKKELKKVKGGIIISKKTLAYDRENQIAIVPAHLFLSVLEYSAFPDTFKGTRF